MMGFLKQTNLWRVSAFWQQAQSCRGRQSLADVLSVSVEDLIHAAPAAKKKRGPASVLQRQIEQIGRMPRAKQKFITEMLDALIIQQQTAQG